MADPSGQRVVNAIRTRSKDWFTAHRIRRSSARISALDALSAREYARTVVLRKDVEDTSQVISLARGRQPEKLAIETSKRTLNILRGTSVFAHYGLIVSPSGLLLADSMVKRKTLIDKLEGGRLHRPTRHIALDRPTYSLSVHPNLYHFWRETMVPLALLHEPEVDQIGPIWVTVTRDLDPWRRQVIEAALPAHAELLMVPENALVRSPLTIFPTPYRSVVFSSSVVKQLREWARVLEPEITDSSTDFVYISRRNTRWRRPRNESELLPELARRNVIPLMLEEMTPADRAGAFLKARAVIGQSGAGLTNLLHARPDTDVLEVRSADHYGEYWPGLTASLGQRITVVGGSDNDPDADLDLPVGNIIAWVDTLQATLRSQNG